jgi:HTH-type transcriptional regulator, competence development regulator
VEQTFGQILRQARKDCEYSQRELAKLIGIDYTYLSKLENDHASYPPSEEVIETLASHLNLDAQLLKKLAGRITPDDEKVFRELVKKYQQMPALLRRMKDNPAFAKQIIEIAKLESEEKET